MPRAKVWAATLACKHLPEGGRVGIDASYVVAGANGDEAKQ